MSAIVSSVSDKHSAIGIDSNRSAPKGAKKIVALVAPNFQFATLAKTEFGPEKIRFFGIVELRDLTCPGRLETECMLIVAPRQFSVMQDLKGWTMSIVVVDCPKQLSFPWMQVEVAPTPVRKARKRNRAAAELAKPIEEASMQVAQNYGTVMSDPCPPVAVVQPSAVKLSQGQPTAAGHVFAFDRNQRVGQVRIGNVMMQLLKRYGITDEEISSVLATIAKEKCENMAS